jgi:hypothetical protein
MSASVTCNMKALKILTSRFKSPVRTGSQQTESHYTHQLADVVTENQLLRAH